MSVQIQLLQSQQSPPFNKNTNNIDIVIPSSYPLVNLSRSSIVFDMELLKNDTTTLRLYDAVFANSCDPCIFVRVYRGYCVLFSSVP